MDHGHVPQLAFAMEIRVHLGAPLEVGQTPSGQRRIIPLAGGTFEGPGLTGTVLAGGADWQLIRSDGVAEIDARYTLETNRGQLIYIRNRGIRHAAPETLKRLLAGETVDPSLVYFRTTPVFETAAPDLQELTRSMYVAIGERRPTEVVIRVWRVA